MRSILKRVQFYCLGLAAILAAVLAFPALAAGPINGGTPVKTTKVYTLYQNGMLTVVKSTMEKKAVTAKLTTVSATSCYAVNVGQKIVETPTAEPAKYIFAVPAPCTTSPNTGVWFNGAIERIDQVGTAGAISFYEVTPLAGEAFAQPNLGYAQVGEEVFVVGSEQMEMKIGAEVISTYSVDVFIQANIAGTVAYGERATRSCSPTGCIVGADALSWGFVVLDKAVIVPPGTAMVNARGQVVGTIIGNDKGMSLAVTLDGISIAAGQLGINLGMKG